MNVVWHHGLSVGSMRRSHQDLVGLLGMGHERAGRRVVDWVIALRREWSHGMNGGGRGRGRRLGVGIPLVAEIGALRFALVLASVRTALDAFCAPCAGHQHKSRICHI